MWGPLLPLLALLAGVPPGRPLAQQPVYHNQFAVHVPAGGAAATDVAARLGYVNKGQIGTLPNFFLLEHPRLRKRSLQGADAHRSALHKEPEVAWAQQQVERRRTKRDFRGDGSLTGLTAAGGAGVAGVANASRAARSSGPYSMFPDPLFKDQWYLNGDTEGSLDMHIQDAWQRGYTGKGVVVSILDDGIQGNHPDLSQNYDPMASADINDSDADPTPRDNGDNKHGTRCAGEVAAQAFNTFCGVGVAYHASIGGVRMLDGTVNDAVEAAALSVNPSHIDVYSASWGPEDDGKTVDGPGPLAKRAFLQGVSTGRKGKGSIFVWASGNGGRHTDSCNCDGYTNSIFTLSISSATQGGYKPWYLEECSSTLATTYSSGTPGRDKSVATVDMDGQLRPDHICTSEHTGTSASAPLAAGICALALEANPSLGWRDMQHLVVRTSRAAPLEREDGWVLNGAKRKVSHKFGYGLMDAAAMVTTAETWTPVPPQHICKSQEMTEERPIDAAKGTLLEMQVDVNGCRGTANEIRHLEHVQARVTLRYSPRGALRITLTSPMGTTSVLLTERPLDTESSNLDDWAFLSVHFWGERADGRWTLRVSNQGKEAAKQNGVVKKWQLVLYGTATDPLYSSSNSSEAGGGAGGVSVVELVPLDGGGVGADATGYHVGDKPAPPLPASMRPLILHDCDHECLESAGCFGKGPTACLACRHYKLDNACVSRCPPRSYLSKDASCLPCHESCETCAGPGQDSCLSCAPAHLRVTDLAVCLQQCPDGYFEDSERGLCIPCASNCVSCSDQPDRCTICAERLLMHDSRCFAACPPGTFNISLDRCQECHSSCDTCAGPDETQCISCPAGRFFLSGTCLRGCPEGWHPDKHAQECAPCALGCTLCTNSGCLVCAQGWVLGPEGRCSREGSGRCKDGEHLDQASGRCSACDAGCLTCHGPGADACLSCGAASPMLYAGRCYPACPDGAYLQDRQPADRPADRPANTCARCPHTCKACVSRQNCTACAPGLELQSGQCRVACADGYYSDGGVCSACYLSCATCVGPRKDECVSCPKGWQLLGGACHPDCPQGHFQTQYGCTRCHHSCRSCDGEGPASCTSCGSRHVLQDGRCAECVRGQYYDATLRRCAPCDATCAACSGPGPYSCTACAAPLQLHKRHHQCVPCCSASAASAASATCCRCRPDSMQGVCPDVSSAGKRRIAEAAVATPIGRGGTASAAAGLAGSPRTASANGPSDWRGAAGPQPVEAASTDRGRRGPHTTSISLTTTTATLAVAVAALLVLIVGIVVAMLQSRSRLAGLAAGGLAAPRGPASRVRGRGRGRPRGRSRDPTAEEEGLLENSEDIQDCCEDSPSVRRDLLGSSPPPQHAVKT